MRQNSVPHIGDAASAWAWEPEPGGPPGPRGVGAGRGGLLPMGRGMCGLVCAVPRTPPSPAACSGREEGASAEWPVTEPRELYRWVCGEGAGPKGQHNLGALCPHLVPRVLAPWEGKENELLGGGWGKPWRQW